MLIQPALSLFHTFHFHTTIYLSRCVSVGGDRPLRPQQAPQAVIVDVLSDSDDDAIDGGLTGLTSLATRLMIQQLFFIVSV